MNMQQYHTPVLLHDCIQALNIDGAGNYVDVTYGGGGHSNEILKHITTGKLIGFDQDHDAHANKTENEKLILVKSNFRYMKNFLRMYAALPVSGILADLGVSSHQFDTGERGFSIRFTGPLDMRMDNASKLTAEKILASYSEEKLVAIFSNYGELEGSKRLANKIVEARSKTKIKSTEQLIELCKGMTAPQKMNTYLAQVFQALRIEVNDELGALKDLLTQSLDVLKPGGRLVVMSYHSLEDRLVKNFMKSGNFEGVVEKDPVFGTEKTPWKMISKKAIVPSLAEIKINNRARSAKLRIAEKK
jgi:16S rRNA (cytosine1402-N4)-methyltransferase